MVYIFFREGGWYPVQEEDESRIPEHVKLNPGTIRVETVWGRVVWGKRDPSPQPKGIR